MFYVLNFAYHRFVTCHTSAEVVREIDYMSQSGITPDDIEVVNCFPDGIRLSVDEFMEQYAAEDESLSLKGV